MGMSSGSSSANLTPEQTKTIDLQNQLLSTLIPTYQDTTKGAKSAYDISSPYVNQAALQGFNTASGLGPAAVKQGGEAMVSASNSLQNLTNADYMKNQIQGNVQPILEANRDLTTGLNTQFLGSGQGGSARHALAQENLSGLNQQRLMSGATKAIADVTGQQVQAASNLGTLGATGVTQGMNANASALNYANAPQSAYAQFANTVFGVPSSASTPNFANTQGQSSKGFKI